MKNKKSSSLILLFLTLLFLAGALLLLTSLFQEKEMNKKYEESKKIAIHSIIKTENKKTEVIGEKVNLDELDSDDFSKFIKSGTFGLLSIPAINVEAPITKGLTENVLRYYIGMYNTTDEPGTVGGNTGLAAHSVIPNSGTCNYCYFNNIGKLKENDMIVLDWHTGKKYTYVVEDVYGKEIKEADIAYVKEKNKSLLTLVTCTNGDNDFRTFVVAKLIKTESN